MTITPEQLQAMRADAARHASAQAEVPSCDFTHDLDAPIDHDAVWCFGEIIVDGGNKRSLGLYAPQSVVDVTAPDAFVITIVAARSAVPALASDVLTLAAEVERLQALLAPTRGDLLVAYASAGAARVEAEEALRRRPVGAGNEEAQRRLVDALADEAAKRAALDAFEREHGLDLTHPDAGDPCPGSRGW